MLALDFSWTTVYLGFEWALRLVRVAVVPLRRSPQAASAWLLLIFFLPWVGRLAPAQAFQAPALSARQEPAAALAERLGRFPPRGGNAVELLADYDATLRRLARDIDAARHHVHLLYYIFADDGATARSLPRWSGRPGAR